VPRPYPEEFRDDVVNVARNREPSTHLKQVAADFGMSASCLTNWLEAADVEDGVQPGMTAAENTDLRDARRRIRLLEQENEELRRAAAYLSPANRRPCSGAGHGGVPGPQACPPALTTGGRLNRPGMSGDFIAWEGWSHGRKFDHEVLR